LRAEKKIVFKDICHYALGELGLSPNSFYFMSFSEYLSVSYGYQVREAKHENLFRTIWVQLNNVNASKKSDLIKNPEKYWYIPLVDFKVINIPTQEEITKAYEIAKQWQNLKFEDEVNFNSVTKKII